MRIGLLGILFVVFLVLKLTGNIAWSWFWVLSPLIVWPFLIVFSGVSVGAIYLLDKIGQGRKVRIKE